MHADRSPDLNGLFRELAKEPYEHRGILHSEIALIIHTCRALGIMRLIESGRARAQSTYLLSKYMPDVHVHSVDMRSGSDEQFGLARVKNMPNVWTYAGDGREIVPQIVSSGYGLEFRTAILCDGPKGAAAVSILEECFKISNVLVGFIHDMRRLDHGGPSPHRQAAIDRLPHHRFSDEPALVSGTSWMDAEVVKAGGPCGPRFEAEFGSYGPTLGVFFNPQQ